MKYTRTALLAWCACLLASSIDAQAQGVALGNPTPASSRTPAVSAQAKAAGSGSVSTQAAASRSQEVTLQIKSDITTQIRGTIFGKVGCDDAGDIFVRQYSFELAKAGTIHQVPVVKIKPDGSIAASFKVADAGPDLHMENFAVNSKGEVYMGTYTRDGEIYVLKFSKDGVLDSKNKLDIERFTPAQISVFDSGELLLSGTRRSEDGPKAFSGIFSSNGKLLHQLFAEGENDLQSGSELSKAISMGDSIAASDGNVYLLRASVPALIYAISPSGELVHKIQVNADTPGLIPLSLRLSSGNLAVYYSSTTSKNKLVKILDVEGNLLSEFAFPDGVSAGFLGCYSPPAFTFAKGGPNDGFVTIRTFEPR